MKVRMFSHSRMSAGREFQVDGAATEKARRASLVRVWGTTSSGALDEHRAPCGAWVCTRLPARWDTLEWLWFAPCESVKPLCRWPTASPEASIASEVAACRQCDPNWPPNSPDLNPVDYSVWAALQQLVYRQRIRDVDHLKEVPMSCWERSAMTCFTIML